MKNLLKKISKKEIIYILLSLILIIVQVWLDLKMPDYMSEITLLVQTDGSKISDILVQGGYMLACSLGSLISACIVGFLAAYIATSFSAKLREELFSKVEEFSMEEMNKFSVSSLITRTTNDVTQVEMLIAMGLQLMIKAPITAIWAVLKILDKNFTWSAITGAAVLILLLTIGILMKLVFPNFKKVQTNLDNVNNVTRENLTGIRVVRAFNGEEYQENYLDSSVVTTPCDGAFTDLIVPEGYIFAMGDNRPQSTDCRSFGCIPINKIEGKVIMRFWPLNTWGNPNKK